MSVLSYPLFDRYHLEVVFSKLRPSVQEPIALVSVDFASSKRIGSKKRQIPFRTLFSPANWSIFFLTKGLIQKMATFCQSVFLVVVEFATVIFSAVLPQR